MITISAAMAIFATNIVVSLIGLFVNNALIERCLFRPYWFLRRREYVTLVSSGFVHADLLHLLFNMITFYYFAFPLERYIGTGRFLILYFAGLLLSHVGTYFKQRGNPNYACLGASGAISAVLFAYVVYFPAQSIMILPLPIPIPAPLFAVGYLAYSYYAARNAAGRINHDAHFNGALAGLAFVALTTPSAFGTMWRIIFG